MREIDSLTTKRYGIPAMALMEAAAAAVARAGTERLSGEVTGKSILVLCGRGNNGGDGAAAARLLAEAGAHAQVVLFGRVENTKGDARTNFETLRGLAREGSGIEFYECGEVSKWKDLVSDHLSPSSDLIIDAMFGTGLTRPLEGLHKEVVEFLRLRRERRHSSGSAPTIISIDIPSGLNSDAADLIGEAVQADLTVTMTAPKVANVLPPADNYNGELIIADIGSPEELVDAAGSQLFVIQESDARRWLNQTRYTPDSYKNTHGHALIVAGSRGYTGAAALCGDAAMHSGAGLVTVATPASAQSLVATQVMPEVMTASLAETDRGAVSDEAIAPFSKLAERADAIAVGPGLSSEDERTSAFVRAIVTGRRTPLVIDADGLNCLAPWPAELRGSPAHPLILTPHPGEMLRLMGASDKTALADRVAAAREFATDHELILVLKGARSLVAAPDGRVFVNPTGNAGLGTAGAGDTLTGIITGFLAQTYGTLKHNADALAAVMAAVYIGGLAGDLAAAELGMRTMVASDIREYLSAAIRLLDPEGEQPPRDRRR